eukprot:TRINITY_DN4392_c0_g1_i1.p1 TRINITY_DN4392_c0_g1~~TRINITY_DN4392_c0_g1_i1.p1  ORF type:complete len:2193 (+),score=1022.20 TRINITY_DN4392_c0_g1_i1:563-6580(+)
MAELLGVWAGLGVLGFLVQGHLSGTCSLANMCRRCTAGYTPIPLSPKRDSLVHKVVCQKTFTYPDNQAYNYFHPDKLPPALQAYAEVTYFTADQLANFFGFQDDNVRNQVEHILSLVGNHRRFCDVPLTFGAFEGLQTIPTAPATGVHSLHAKLFENYRGWCKNLNVPPCFTPVADASKGSGGPFAAPGNVSQQDEVQALLTDIMLYMCIWGEGANLRHMPECLCFLYHKMMAEFLSHRHHGTHEGDQTALYAGYFLDHVVTPIWEVVVKYHKAKGDHVQARNYDDFNEFFWTPECLTLSYRDVETETVSPPRGSRQHLDKLVQEAAAGPKPGSTVIPVHKALARAPKTFLEKRSLLSTMLTFNRIVEFHVVTFYICAMLSFAEILVWEKAYKLQLTSSVFLIFNLCGIVWCILEVWHSYPGINISGTAKTGFLLRLCIRFLLLVYQALYFMWSVDSPSTKAGMQVQGPPLFWWWQYLWLSCLAMSTYIIEALMQLWPWLTTFILTRDSDFVNAFLNLFFPMSRLYVGKAVHESLHNAVRYCFFCFTLIAWKLYFSYQYEVKILVVPTIELYDDFVNFGNQSFWRTTALIVLRWVPQAFIYLIDTSIWFAFWSAMAGSAIGFQERLGEVRDFKTMRGAFMRIPEEFCKKVICEKVTSRDSSMVDLTAAASRIAPAAVQPNGDVDASETTGLLAAARAEIGGMIPPRYVDPSFLDVRTQKWAAFAAVWNEVINQMRLSDVISNAEQDMLKFHKFTGFSKPVYLPIFQTAGSVELAVNIMADEASMFNLEDIGHDSAAVAKKHEQSLRQRIMSDRTVREAVSEVWELGAYFLRHMLGPVHEADMARIEVIMMSWMVSEDVLPHVRLERIASVVADVTAIFTILHQSLPRRISTRAKEKAPPLQAAAAPSTRSSSSGGMKRAVSTGGLSSLQGGSGFESGGRRSNMTPRNATAPVLDKTRDQVREKLRPLLNSIRGMMKTSAGDGGVVQDLLQQVLSQEQGFMWDDAYATGRLNRLAEDQHAISMLSKLYGLLAVQVNDAEPASPEARRRLAFFVNSLFMDMPRAPPVNSMLSWSCVTPYYSEDVLYSRKDLEARNEDGLSTLMYLQALYKHAWRNFVERMGIEDEQQIWSKRYFQETRLWASLRAQTLSRTVEGMMYYEAALRLLAHLEKIQPEQAEAIVRHKFQYVVACQVYGRMKKIQDPKADDIDRLLKRFPNLRVAYIDEVRVTREGQCEYFSVLIKAKENGQSIEEVYRVKLPGNPVIGEGKPENQNHAIIFTRGEHVQAIDMNQEGYFEEALKMRCLLQEFQQTKSDPPTTIVGFREHIFTGSVSSLANYMALQELSFVTIGQRVLDNPLRIRMHYGHPDLFDKVFFMTRGGMSKASKGINLSEDIFAGYNNAIRGGQVVFREYAQVGKGRDVGMQQIYKFEAKLAQGAAEQSLSRDTNRLGARLDFFRLWSFYFGGLGYYIGNFITVVTIVFVVYFMLAEAVFQVEKIGERKITPEGTLQMLLAGMGVLNTLPMLATLMVEKGLRAALVVVGQVFVSGGPMYFMFHIQTRAHYFYQTLLAGGAQYRATGRGFVTHHSTFDDLYRFFATSHFYLGFELAAALIIMACTSAAKQYIGRTWSLWLACISFLFAPFWFNPLSFEWSKCVSDYKRWMRWMSGTGGSSSNSWEVWWREDNGYMSKFGLGQKLQCMLKPAFYLVIGVGIATPKMAELQDLKPKEVQAIIKVSSLALALLLGYAIVDKCGHTPWIRRSGKLIISSVVFCGGIALMIKHYEYIRIAIGLYYVLAALSGVCVLLGFTGMRVAYHIHDFILGHVLFLALFLMAALQFPKDVQTWLLFHNALSQGVVIEDILKYARKNQEATAGNEDKLDDTAELKKLIKHQEYMLQQLMARAAAHGGGTNGVPNGRENGAASRTSSLSGGDGRPGVLTMPLADDDGADSDTSVAPASMMRASRSTLDLSKMASTSTRRAQAEAQAAAAEAALAQQQAFQFRGPANFPPRDP